MESSSTNVMENEDLLTLILSLVPTKSVVWFKVVSKQWLSLISLPSFSILHTSLSPPSPFSTIIFPHPNNNSLFHFLKFKNICTSTSLTSVISTKLPKNNRAFTSLGTENSFTSTPFASINFTNDSSGKNSATSTPFTSFSSTEIPKNTPISLSFTKDPSGEIEILQSCYGLLLCSSGTSWDGIDTRLFYVFNPVTKQFYTLPPPENPPSCHVLLSMFTKISLAFEPSKSPYYKVLLVRKADGKTNRFRFDIFSSKTREWRKWGDDVEWSGFEVFCKGVYLNGAVYWASKHDGFVCFDMERECLAPMPVLPNLRNENGTIRYLGESRGHLYLVDSRFFEFDVFEMARESSDWVLKYHVDLVPILEPIFGTKLYFQAPMQSNFCNEKTNISLLSVCEVEGNGCLCLVLHFQGKIISYNLECRSIAVIGNRFLGNVERIIPALVRGFGGYQYVETLACV